MKIKTVNGSYYQIVGVDKSLDWLRGTNPVGVILSEYSVMTPLAWDVIRPILKENGGWALFNYTPMGENHGFDLYQMAKNNPDWFCSLLTVNDTKRDDGSPLVSEKDIEEERNECYVETVKEAEALGFLRACRWKSESTE